MWQQPFCIAMNRNNNAKLTIWQNRNRVNLNCQFMFLSQCKYFPINIFILEETTVPPSLHAIIINKISRNASWYTYRSKYNCNVNIFGIVTHLVNRFSCQLKFWFISFNAFKMHNVQLCNSLQRHVNGDDHLAEFFWS